MTGEVASDWWVVGSGSRRGWVLGWVGLGGEPGSGTADGGNDGNVSNAISACGAGSAGKAGGDGGVSEGPVDALDIAEHVSVEMLRYQMPRSRKEYGRLLA